MNYQNRLDNILIKEEGKLPKLLLHACCAPCSSYVLEYLNNYFSITIFYYNPNISDITEYKKRIIEEKRLIEEMDLTNKVSFIEGNYEPLVFNKMALGLEELKEGGKRCYLCYKLRLEETARVAKENNFDYFGTTLSISPHKNSEYLNSIGEEIANKEHINYLFSDFKKKNGYKRSIELSEKYHLYRQDYCGCVYSRLERDRRNNNKIS
ncbi:MAG: epoxyqueuosine reductase QueH [Bacilli bacterium]